MTDFVLQAVLRIPKSIRNEVLSNGIIDKASPYSEEDKDMHYLFDLYERFIDLRGEHDDWTCNRCRQIVLSEWKKFKPYIQELNENS